MVATRGVGAIARKKALSREVIRLPTCSSLRREKPTARRENEPDANTGEKSIARTVAGRLPSACHDQTEQDAESAY